jgi:hypothetical protein
MRTQHGAALPASFRERGGPIAIDRERGVAVALGGVDRGLGRGVDDDIRVRGDHLIAGLSGPGEIDLRAYEEIHREAGRPRAAAHAWRRRWAWPFRGNPRDRGHRWAPDNLG